MEKDKKKIFLNTVFWGSVLWAFGYILGIIFFPFFPKESLGWYILPFGLAATLLVLFKKIERDSFTCYVGLGIIWAIMAIFLDYIFLVRLFGANDYYKMDVYVYYFLMFALPIIAGFYKAKNKKKS
ncbi:MAG: hypothetical protein PHW52_03775 [Candidatus Pacebacteria bacterium]|nr:hypothetical protein [Candidatus Paceibacterota bacterium]